jgi:hypothetical protein
MESNRRTVWTPLARAVLVTGVIACLCFSAGEGLRLTPLPATPPAEAAASDLQANAALSRGATLNRTGPLDMPAQGQAQKRGKRQTLECECPPAGAAREITFQPLRYSGASRLLVRASRLSVSQPSGRAPPPAS